MSRSWGYYNRGQIVILPDNSNFGIDNEYNIHIPVLPDNLVGINYNWAFLLALTNEQKNQMGFYELVESKPTVSLLYFHFIENDPVFDAENKVINITYSTKPRNTTSEINAIKDNLINKVKYVANTRILNIAPEWKQRNFINRKLDLMTKASLTDDEKKELDDINMIWTAIDSIRQRSNDIETKIRNMTFSILSDYNIENENWD